MIPVLGVPVLNRPDLLEEMLDSVDVPVRRRVIVDNGGVIEGREAVRPGINLGVAASWNLIVKATPDAPWWAIVNSDVVFGEGDLADLAHVMAEVGGLVMLRDMAAYGISAETVDRVGFFDENFHPAYCEDIDYQYRCRMAEVRITQIGARLTHRTSSTIGSDPRFAAANARTYPQNVAYYTAKWGGWAGQESFTTPFNRGGSVADWTLDRRRLAELRWEGAY